MDSMSTYVETDHPREPSGQWAPKPRSAPEVSLHPDAQAARATNLKARHDELMAEGAFASPWNNAYIADFEDEHHTPTADDLRTAMDAIVGEAHPEDAPDGDEVLEREAATAELSRRLIAGQAGIETSSSSLAAGDRFDMSRFAEDDDGTPWVLEIQENLGTAEGETLFRTDRGLVTVPAGAVVPVVGYQYRGERVRERELLQRLRAEGLVPARQPRERPADVIAEFLRKNEDVLHGDEYPSELEAHR